MRSTARSLALLAAAGAVLTIAACGSSPTRVPAGPGAVAGASATTPAPPSPIGSPTDPPPAGSPAGLRVVITPTTLPATGGNLVFAVVNSSGDDATYGVDGELDHWVGGGWQHVRSFAAAVSFWAFDGALAPVGQGSAPAIGLLAHDGPGALEWLHVDNLPAGWYRIRQGGGSGVFAVAAGPVPTPWDDGDDHLPGILGAVIGPNTRQLSTSAMDADPNDVLGAPAGEVTLQRWSAATGWTTVGQSVSAAVAPSGFTVALPPLVAGTYRLAGSFRKLGQLTGPLVVFDQTGCQRRSIVGSPEASSASSAVSSSDAATTPSTKPCA